MDVGKTTTRYENIASTGSRRVERSVLSQCDAHLRQQYAIW